ncbi:TagK domain-containing protein [Variovorax arabinosiphilus]|uniref:TagK domain-containing protein n=1 Tax=Variovorax arabinosiphilus TaxID=3053498 RepID=UPI0025772CC4|nr:MULTISPECIES: TagK domain-containing protein [unclassified Variovorax]MDM0120859.1 TagK domain-containing protein [Variovorax sp. J2L1-78]MDM0127229.1 TagK domain-containing protein [Variovorax sp. J2L1-63]MDM0236239.1 TagK domain-containing protein [Variovorax sp. J2R1-6]
MSASAMPTPIRLRLVRSHGDAVDLALPVPPQGRGLADALELGGERLNDTQWRSANRCRIVPNGDAWQLANESPTLVCTLNGIRVRASTSVALAAGDMLELALLRFLVEPALDDAMSAAPTRRVAGPSVVHQAAPKTPPSAIADAVEFDLRDLAFPAQETGAQRASAASDDPFGVLDIDGAEALPAANPLAELLGEDPAPQRRRDRRAPPPREDGAPADGAPLLAGQPSTAMREDALFAGLHEEFVRVARDPTQLAGRTDWEGLLATGGALAPSFDDLVRQGEPYPMVRDILEPRESIDQVIEDFDPLGRPTLLDVRDDEDILHLFAPELARKAVTAMPSLTRQEHHHLSPDSHLQLGAARPEEPEASRPLRFPSNDTNPPHP